jgi:hypothetical protein
MCTYREKALEDREKAKERANLVSGVVMAT